MKSSSLTQGGMIITGVWSFFSTSLGALYAILIFDFNVNPIFEEALGRFEDGNLNSPILRYFIGNFPTIGGPLLSIVITIITMLVVFGIMAFLAVFLYETKFELSSEQEMLRTTNNYEFIQAYAVFSLGNLIFIYLYFTELVYILSSTYIELWEERNQEIFLKVLPASELWIIIGFGIVSLHALWNVLVYYSPQLQELYQNFKVRVMNDSE
jgi:hypothetical protein